MSNSVRYQTMQQPQRRYHPKSPIPQVPVLSVYTNPRSNSNVAHQFLYPTSVATPLPTSNQSSAYFIDRVDLEDYASQTLKQTVDNVLSKMKSKGLRVKISLPDEGLVIDNIPDPMQSWIFKTSELLYFWRDPYYADVIVVVTKSRLRHQPNRPYSASLFRLRGTESAQAFLQTAQKFFAKLSASTSPSNVMKPDVKVLAEASPRSQARGMVSTSSSSSKSRTKHRLSVHDPSGIPAVTDHLESPQRTTPIRLITRAEFDPGKAAAQSVVSVYNRRTLSETASSTDSQTTNPAKEVLSFTKKMTDPNHDDDEKMTTLSTQLSGESVTELMRELKELRHEIAALKIDKRMPPTTRSMSTSPMLMYSEHVKHMKDSSTITPSPTFIEAVSQLEVDAETQTDFSLLSHRRRNLLKKNKKTMVGSGTLGASSKSKSESSSIESSARTLSSSSTTTASEQEETTPDTSSHVNDSLNDVHPAANQEQHQPIVLSAPPRPVLMRHQKHFVSVNTFPQYAKSNDEQAGSNVRGHEEGSFPATGIPTTPEKEMPKFLSTYASSSTTPDPVRSISTTDSGSTTSNNDPIYENVPTLLQTKPTRAIYYNTPKSNRDDPQSPPTPSNGHVYYTIANSRESESQPSSVSRSAVSQQTNGVAAYPLLEQGTSTVPTSQDSLASISSMSTETNPTQKPQIVSSGRHRSQPVYFANHLTNPLFNVDKQLLINTIANQFGVDLQSPQLQNLIQNQHLFVARKRTFANMVWQMTPDEETALCSSPVTSKMNRIDVDVMDPDETATRSILKATKQATAKRRSITWDNALQ